MPRKGPVPKRDVLPDPVYNSKLVTRFINKVMYDGKKGIAETIVYDAFEIIRSKMGQDPMEVFDQALKNVMPVLEAVSYTHLRAHALQSRKKKILIKWQKLIKHLLIIVGNKR